MAARTASVKEELSKKAGSIKRESEFVGGTECPEVRGVPEGFSCIEDNRENEISEINEVSEISEKSKISDRSDSSGTGERDKKDRSEIKSGQEGQAQMQKVRLLRANEIECRIGTINEKGLSLLLFKDARVDQKILDETFSPFGWKRTHQCIDGNLYCTVEIWDENKEQWIAKQDVGTTSYSEKEKGQASDSFKRACFNWGVGRELYSAPFIWIPAKNTNIDRKDNRFYTNDHFSVREISYNEHREIASLSIVNQKGEEVYHMKEKQSSNGLSETQIKALEKELERTGVSLKAVLDRYHIQRLEQMTNEIYTNAINSLRKTKEKNAA